ncbi:MAG: response regulator [Desulfovibrionales bacterium]
MEKNKILVVDDELHIRMLYQEELEAEGYEVATSDGSEHIVSLVEREKPDVLILDIKLGPDRSGLDLLQELRRRYQELPVILCTAYDPFQHDFKSIAADYYVIKSIDLTELKAKIRQALNKQSSSAKGTEEASR